MASRSTVPGRSAHRARADVAQRLDRGRSRSTALADAVVPASLRGARWSVGASAALALLVLVAVVGVAAAIRTAQAAPGVPVPARSEAVAAPAPAQAPPDPSLPVPAGGVVPGAAPAPASTGVGVVVHVVGAVGAPGLVSLPVGARVGDALAAAGGVGPDADLTRVNLARVLVDGEQVVVPRPGEEIAAPVVPGAGAVAATAAGPLDLNTATLQQLDTLPGIGPVLAQRILDWRAEHGAFSSVAELNEVSGIGDAVLADIESLVRV